MWVSELGPTTLNSAKSHRDIQLNMNNSSSMQGKIDGPHETQSTLGHVGSLEKMSKDCQKAISSTRFWVYCIPIKMTQWKLSKQTDH